MIFRPGWVNKRFVSRRNLLLGGTSFLAFAPFQKFHSYANALSISEKSGFQGKFGWDRNYEDRWGSLGAQPLRQIENVVHAENGIYDDSDGVFAWIVHYWLRAWSRMAVLTGDEKYLNTAISFIDYVFAHTDENRIKRGEISENYLREPLGLQGSGKGGPIWKRWEEANVLNTGQVVHGILRFVDTVFENRHRWPGYLPVAQRYFSNAKLAVDAFNSDWKTFGNKGSYYYRDSGGTNVLGTTETAFNQSATMCAAHLLIDKWESDETRRDKAKRLARYWVEDFIEVQDDGSLTWPYIIHDELQVIEDTGHATVDLDFLILAHELGIKEISSDHITGLAKTFKNRVWREDASLNEFLDGTTSKSYDEHYNAGFGWFELSRYDDDILPMVLATYEKHYPSSAPAGQIWARPMLGWANILAAVKGN